MQNQNFGLPVRIDDLPQLAEEVKQSARPATISLPRESALEFETPKKKPNVLTLRNRFRFDQYKPFPQQIRIIYSPCFRTS